MKILITASLTKDGVQRLRKYGQVDYAPMAETKRMLGGSQLVEALNGVDIFITEAENLKEREISRLTTLQVICCCRGNPVNIDIKSATARGIPVLYVPGRNAEGVAELAVLLMLMLSRKIMQVAKAIRRSDASQDMTILSKIYFDYKGSEVWGKTIGIVGLGAVGRKVAELLKPFNVHLIAYDPYVDQEVMSQFGVKKVKLTELMKQSDIVTLHIMPSETNKKMIGAQEIGMLKPSAYLINTSRSAVTDENAIYAALRDKKIAGAGLDVFDKEPIPFDHPFMSLNNVIILPHIGGDTLEVNAHQTEILLPELEKLLNEERPTLIMNPEVLATFKFKGR